jgi:tRNA modification GTPase
MRGLEDWAVGIADDTIVAISTPPGRGGIGIVRLSGPDAIAIAARLLRISGDLGAASQHARARRARVLDPKRVEMVSREGTRPDADIDETSIDETSIDDALVTVFHAPHSYTGEPLVEIAAHGAPVVLEAIVAAALAEGARLAGSLRLAGCVRLARAGEFTQRAFLSGRLDLTQAEAVHDLITAQTLDQARVAAQQMGGALSRRVAPAKEFLLHLITLLEAGMDFASGELDDVEVVAPAQIAAGIEATRAPLYELAASFERGQILRNGAAIAIVGPANAGKSSLFNRLLERERAIVTPVAGTTRDTVEESLALGGIPLRLIDTAGLRDLEPGAAVGTATISPEDAPRELDEAERQGIPRSREALADADLVLLVHDATQPLTAPERALAASLGGRPHLLLWNKIDLLAASVAAAEVSPSCQEAMTERKDGDATPEMWLSTSALTGDGLHTLRAAILRELHAEGALAATGALNNLRQQQSVAAALDALTAAKAANARGLPHELILMDLHAALEALDSLTGVTTPDDILARIFSSFCIGK